MKILKVIILIILSLGIISDFKSQVRNVKTPRVLIYGHCEICKGVIEKTGWRKYISPIRWVQISQTAVVEFDSGKTNASELLKKIALAGYTHALYFAPIDASNSLSPCCQNKKHEHD